MNISSFSPQESDTVGKCRKEDHFAHSYKVIALLDGVLKEIIDLRVYRTASRCYVAVWVKYGAIDPNVNGWAYGGGWAGGGGYDKESAAAWNALTLAGVIFGEPWGGSGRTEEAISSLANYLLPEGTVYNTFKNYG